MSRVNKIIYRSLLFLSLISCNNQNAIESFFKNNIVLQKNQEDKTPERKTPLLNLVCDNKTIDFFKPYMWINDECMNQLHVDPEIKEKSIEFKTERQKEKEKPTEIVNDSIDDTVKTEVKKYPPWNLHEEKTIIKPTVHYTSSIKLEAIISNDVGKTADLNVKVENFNRKSRLYLVSNGQRIRDITSQYTNLPEGIRISVTNPHVTTKQYEIHKEQNGRIWKGNKVKINYSGKDIDREPIIKITKLSDSINLFDSNHKYVYHMTSNDYGDNAGIKEVGLYQLIGNENFKTVNTWNIEEKTSFDKDIELTSGSYLIEVKDNGGNNIQTKLNVKKNNPTRQTLPSINRLIDTLPEGERKSDQKTLPKKESPKKNNQNIYFCHKNNQLATQIEIFNYNYNKIKCEDQKRIDYYSEAYDCYQLIPKEQQEILKTLKQKLTNVYYDHIKCNVCIKGDDLTTLTSKLDKYNTKIKCDPEQGGAYFLEALKCVYLIPENYGKDKKRNELDNNLSQFVRKRVCDPCQPVDLLISKLIENIPTESESDENYVYKTGYAVKCYNALPKNQRQGYYPKVLEIYKHKVELIKKQN